MSKHRLVVIGDSLSQGFMSGAISSTDISYPALAARTLGIYKSGFIVPDFHGEGGLPINLEFILGKLSKKLGFSLNWLKFILACFYVQYFMNKIENYWERGEGSKPYPRQAIHHNLSVWGFEVRDAFTVTEGTCRRTIPPPRNNFLNQITEMPMYRTARRVLNPAFSNVSMEWHQIRNAQELARDGGIENLILFLGANNCLGTVTSLTVNYSTDQDLYRMPHERNCNLYLPDHFCKLYSELANAVLDIKPERVFVGTVPHVTIPPVTRGVSPDGTIDKGYFEFYTRPWIWDEIFNKDKVTF